LYKTAHELLEQVPLQDRATRVTLNAQLRLVVRPGADIRRENLQVVEEVAGLILDDTGESRPQELTVAFRRPEDRLNHLLRVKHSHPAYFPLGYVLLFPRGELGWHWNLLLQGRNRSRTKVSLQMFCKYRIHQRSNERSLIFYAGRLFQQLLVNFFANIELDRLNWVRFNQATIRAESYDQIPLDDAFQPCDIGRRVILPSSFTGGDRYMQHIYQDGMAILRVLGKPDLFITFTANPKWNEITRELKNNQQACDRPDIVCRVFKLKLDCLIKELQDGLFGPYAGILWTIEYQKRGLPHAHILLFLSADRRPDYLQASNIDEIICAEFPDPAWDPTGDLTQVVSSSMTHGPCGPDFPNAPCMVNKNGRSECSKRFPKSYCTHTKVREDGYPEYRRRQDGVTVTKRVANGTIQLDNRWVVPYNPYLLRKYEAHINVELCATVQSILYIFKYVTKGSDRTTAHLGAQNQAGSPIQNPDEIDRYLSARYIGPHESCWRILEYRTHGQFPPVTALCVHLEAQQEIQFDNDIDPDVLADRAASSRTQLMAFFD
jgi:hypothetical protein